ncbi:MAG: methionine biosynthesis protein MetW [Gammaproteobacteria bacterium]|nr:methionine biosynthesis protein MetW [Gammaproteobacteria bacterium]
MRPDFKLIVNWIEPGSKVLDLGCGDGTLLAYLQDYRYVRAWGLEIEPDNIVACIEKGVNVIQTDIDAGLSEFDDDSFDYVVLTETLQAVYYPHRLLKEMLRVGKHGIVSFPNFGHWRSRFQMGFGGRMPVTPALPNQWYDTPNIHLCTVKDFEKFCVDLEVNVVERLVLDERHQKRSLIQLMPNLFGTNAMYRMESANYKAKL